MARAIALVGLLALGCGAALGLHVLMTRLATPVVGFDAIFAPAFELGEARRSADIVVDRRLSGTLVISGRRLSSPKCVNSLEEFRAALSSVGDGGLGVVFVEYPANTWGSSSRQLPPDLASAAEDIRKALLDAGFRPFAGRRRKAF